jgi:hypothetical protein
MSKHATVSEKETPGVVRRLGTVHNHVGMSHGTVSRNCLTLLQQPATLHVETFCGTEDALNSCVLVMQPLKDSVVSAAVRCFTPCKHFNCYIRVTLL